MVTRRKSGLGRGVSGSNELERECFMYEELNNIATRGDFLQFMDNLIKDNKYNEKEWENKEICSYLDSISSWVESMEGFYLNIGQEKPADIDWQFIATLFYVGKIYE